MNFTLTRESTLIQECSPPRYAFFDVDGTVIQKDSFRIIIRELIFKQSIPRTVLAALLFSLLCVFWILRFAGKTQFKSALLWAGTVGRGRKKSLEMIRKIVQVQLQPLWFCEMRGVLETLRSEGFKVCYVSASGEFWLRALINKMDPESKLIVGSKLMFFMGGLTLKGANCIGPEKIKRLNALLPSEALWEVAYSDHRADIPLFLACKKRIVVNPSPKSQQAIDAALGANNYTLVHWTVGN
jgi:phosphatidylglycerophosphatase C